MDIADFGHGLHERIAEPLGEFVEGYHGFPRAGCGGRGHGGQGPRIANRGSIDFSSGCRPDRGEAISDDAPESGDGDDGDGCCLCLGMGDEVVCRC